MNFWWAPILLIFVTAISASNLDVAIKGENAFRERELMDALPDMTEKLSDKQVKSWSEDAGDAIESFYKQSGFFSIKVETQVRNPNGSAKTWRVLLSVS